jgi:hypothetical protein
MCIYFNCFKKQNLKNNFEYTNGFLPQYNFNISDYRHLLNKSMGEVMRELNYDYPLSTFVISRAIGDIIPQNYEKKRSSNIFTLWVNDRHQVVNITLG